MATALLHGVLIVEAAKCRMIWHAMLMFLLGLVTGLAEQRFTNVRMGLSARLEGVMNGTFLMAVGAIWNEMRLSQPAKTSAFWTALYGTYANWLTTTLGAIARVSQQASETHQSHHR